MDRQELLASTRAAVSADSLSDLETGLAAAVLRYAVQIRGSVPRGRLLAEAQVLLAPLVTGSYELQDLLERELDALLSIGEVVLRQPAPGARIHIEPGAPAFVVIAEHPVPQVLVLGGDVEGRPLLPAALADLVSGRGRARWIVGTNDLPRLRDELQFHGLREIDFSSWAQTPARVPAFGLVAPYLERARPVSAERVSALEVFDPSKPNLFYRGRIHPAPADEVVDLCKRFRFIPARDPEAEAGTYYSVLSERDGELKIASIGYGVEARDEWLRLAGATCHSHGTDRAFAYERESGLLRLFFPPPSWLERLLTLGAPMSAGGLCSFSLEDAVWPEVERALTEVCFAVQRTT
jgi:hypothetical protein